MNNGYQIIEPTQLAGLFGWQHDMNTTVALLHWLIEEAETQLGDQIKDYKMSVIRVIYLGEYPALGVEYSNSDLPDIGPLIEKTVNDLLSQKTVQDFVDFLSNNPVNWEEATLKIMTNSEGQ